MKNIPGFLYAMKHYYPNDPFYSSPEWKKKRAAILARDNYQCQVCKRYGKIKQATIVHHIKEIADFPEASMDNDNLMSVCLACHNRLHPNKSSAMNNTKYQRRYDP